MFVSAVPYRQIQPPGAEQVDHAGPLGDMDGGGHHHSQPGDRRRRRRGGLIARGGGLNPGTGEISLMRDLNSITGEESPIGDFMRATVHLTRQAAADSRARNRDHGHRHALGSLSVALPERDAPLLDSGHLLVAVQPAEHVQPRRQPAIRDSDGPLDLPDAPSPAVRQACGTP